MTFTGVRLTLISAVVFLAGALRAATPSFDQWADAFAADWVRLNPQLATRAQYFSGAEQDANDRQLGLTDMFGGFTGTKAARAHADLARRGLQELRGFPRAGLTPMQRTSAAVIQWSLEDALHRAEFAPEAFVFEQIGGYQLGLVNFLTTTHPLRNRRDAENYLARLALVGGRLDDGIAEAESAAAKGIIPPRFILKRVIEQLDGFVAKSAAENPFVATFKERLASVGAVTAGERTTLVAAAEKEVRDSVLPAYRRLRATLTAQLAKSNDDAGAWRLPRGEEFYAAMLETSTTTKKTAEEIHAIGLREVARIEGEMDVIFKQLGHPEGTVKSRYEKVSAGLKLPTGPDPRAAMIAHVDAVVQDGRRRAAAVFDLRPKAPVIVKREPEFSEKTAAAHYTDPAPDGSLPGIYWIPLPNLDPQSTWLGPGLKSIAYHEAIPGHHFQLALQQEMADLPRYRKLGIFGMATAYIEGWALYAERLADEKGWYEGDLIGRLGYLQMQLFRARRLVVDTGVHAKKWTRQQLIDYGLSEVETERYIVWPGQACAYMIGQLRILELREQAKAALGARFSIKEFHNVVLRGGSMPLDVLAQEVDAWVAASGGRATTGARK